MKKYTTVLLAALAVLIAVTAGTASAADNVSNGTTICKVIATHYECDSWSDEQYPIIDLCGEKYVPLFTTKGNIRDTHVNKLASLILDSNETYILKPGEKKLTLVKVMLSKLSRSVVIMWMSGSS
ncbi:hypothetical protein [Methanosarcina horonobensis]|uniref:hypothetical protein n=1 Tax=Methanosarcina horonobensis TaxID=418008 RepID=UPI000A656EC2|nr:hypothetical protein [Methanosarcina horonobensis]